MCAGAARACVGAECDAPGPDDGQNVPLLKRRKSIGMTDSAADGWSRGFWLAMFVEAPQAPDAFTRFHRIF